MNTQKSDALAEDNPPVKASEQNKVCPVEHAGHLDSRIRRWVQNPLKILTPYIKKGMTAMDLGCGPGFFTLDMAGLVGDSGRVIAADLQEGMLQKLKTKIEGSGLEGRITLHRCSEKGIGFSDKVDFVLAFYLVHEVPDQAQLFTELASMLTQGGRVLVVEPPFHVSKSAFKRTLALAEKAGLIPETGPKVFLSKTALLKKP